MLHPWMAIGAPHAPPVCALVWNSVHPRLLDVMHGSQVSQLENAFAALGKRLIVAVEDAPAAPRALRRRKAGRHA